MPLLELPMDCSIAVPADILVAHLQSLTPAEHQVKSRFSTMPRKRSFIDSFAHFFLTLLPSHRSLLLRSPAVWRLSIASGCTTRSRPSSVRQIH